MSGTSSHVMRHRRVAHGIPELTAALSEGLVSEYRAGEIARLKDPREQQLALAHWSARAQEYQDGQRLAAEILRRYLAEHTGDVDLDKLCNSIREGIKGAVPS